MRVVNSHSKVSELTKQTLPQKYIAHVHSSTTRLPDRAGLQRTRCARGTAAGRPESSWPPIERPLAASRRHWHPWEGPCRLENVRENGIVRGGGGGGLLFNRLLVCVQRIVPAMSIAYRRSNSFLLQHKFTRILYSKTFSLYTDSYAPDLPQSK